MGEEPEPGYMFAYTYGLDVSEISKIIDNEILKLDAKYHKYNLKINVVKNKENKLLGYSYLWIDNYDLYYALTGFNFDGSKRVEKIETEIETEEKEIDSWGDVREDIQITYKNLEPLINFPSLEIDDLEKINYRLASNIINFNILQATKYISPEFKNSLYARYIPHWLTEKMVLDYFKPFERDTILHHTKNKKFNYPIVKIKNKNINITFSNLYPNTASFLVNMAKKVYFSHPQEDKGALIFFNQDKKRNYD